ncbi:UNVERIFIED_CONTAM: hypothetical protein Sindi_0052000 [Sesamum indicum]
MSSSSDYVHFLKEILGGNDPSEATSKTTGPALLRFRRGLRRSLRQANAAARRLINEEEEGGEKEGEASSLKEERVRLFPEGVESPESSSTERPSGSPKEMPSVQEEEEEEEKVPELPSDLGPSILRTSSIDQLL